MNLGDYTPSTGMPNMDRTTTWLFGTLFLTASATLYGDAQIAAFGYSLTELLMQTPFSLAGIGISWASIASLAAIGGAYAGNNADIKDFRDEQTGLAVVTALIVVVTTLSPTLIDWINASSGRGIVVTALVSLGYLSMSEVTAIHGGKQ